MVSPSNCKTVISSHTRSADMVMERTRNYCPNMKVGEHMERRVRGREMSSNDFLSGKRKYTWIVHRMCINVSPRRLSFVGLFMEAFFTKLKIVSLINIGMCVCVYDDLCVSLTLTANASYSDLI